MSASLSAASSNLTRSNAAVLVFTSLAAAYLIYYHHSSFYDDLDQTTRTVSGPGLHRSNAIHRRRRRAESDSNDQDVVQRRASSNAADDEENEILRTLGDGETVIDEQGQEEFDWGGEPPPSQRNGQNIVQLLFRVSEDATRRNAYVHRGCQCNSCGTVPIRGVRYRCSNCADFDLCEACEAQGLHIKTHVFYKVRVPTSSFAARQMQPVWYPGDPDTCMKSLPRDLITKLSKDTGFDRPELDAYWEQWTFMANTEWREDPDGLCLAMDRKTFEQCLVPSGGNRHAAPNLIHDRMFAFYDTNHDDLISFPEFLGGLAYRKKKEKLKRVFEGYDINGDGFVDRKDFLRMFRSYYILYKQMHRDLLEGLDDQVMNSTDTHQLITSRQPLSSAFGRDGRFPAAPDTRLGEGKAAGVGGDLEIIDGKGVVSDSSNDLGNKEEVIIDAVVREYPRWLQQAPAWGVTGGSTYWNSLQNPPETIESLQHDVLDGLVRERRRMLQDANQIQRYQQSDTEAESDDGNETAEGGVAHQEWPPTRVTLVDVEAVCGEGIAVTDVAPSRRSEVVEHADKRIRELAENNEIRTINEEIHERWKRRQFYTDEEEGAVAPSNWKDEEDIPYQNGKTVESSKETNLPSQPISPRSRSSSKVRFAEDTDDYEIRSNPSTSSRSVPERWGGMEIPEAEKDAGKEILYQVTQQAYNELLDQLFKKQEDLAVKALSSTKTREKYRHMFTNPTFEQWCLLMDKGMKKSKKKRTVISIEQQTDVAIPDLEVPDICQPPPEQVVAASGYDIGSGVTRTDDGSGPSDFEPDHIQGAPVSNISNHIAGSTQAAPEVSIGSSAEPANPVAASALSSPPTTDLVEVANNSDGIASLGTKTETSVDESLSRKLPEGDIQQPLHNFETTEPGHDPTLPQFRPTSISSSTTLPALLDPAMAGPNQPNGSDPIDAGEEPLGADTAVIPENPDISAIDNHKAQTLLLFKSSNNQDKPVFTEHQKSYLMTAKQGALDGMPEELRKKFMEVDWKMLYDLRDMEAAEKQAESRGGWGRLSWEEFEQMVKGEEEKAMPENVRVAMTDYLGSWIEFCIP